MRTDSFSVTRAGPTFWLLVSWAAIDGAVAIYLAAYGVNAASSMLLVLGLMAFVAAAIAAPRAGTPVLGGLLVLVGAHVVLRAVIPFRAEAPPPIPLFQALAAGAAIALLIGVIWTYRTGDHRGLTWALLLVIGLGMVFRAAIVLVDVTLPFDVPLIQEAAADALRNGADPYLTRVYHSGYPYLPVAALAAMLGSLMGDARWAVVVGDALTIAGLLLASRRLALPSPVGVAIGALWAWTSGGFYVTWQGFPEPILTGFLAVGAALLVGPAPRRVAAGVMLGLSVGTKQLVVGVLPFLVRSAKGRVALAVALATATVCIVPLALWHPAEFAEGTFWSHLAEPGRGFALNLLAWSSFQLDAPLIIVLPFSLVVGWWASHRFADVDSAWLAGSAGLLLVAFLLNRLAFANYYAIPLVLMLLLIMACSPRAETQALVASATPGSAGAP